MTIFAPHSINFSGPGDGANFTFNGFVAGLKHFLREINRTITGRFRAHEGTAPIARLAREHAGKLVGKPFILPKEITYFAPTYPNIAGRHIGVGTDVPEQLGHKRLAKPHDFVVGFRLRIEIRAALAAAHRQSRERVLKNLFECEELDDAGRDGGVKTQAALIRSQGAVHLDAKTAVHLDPAFVVDPWDAELDYPFRFDKALENFAIAILLVALNHRSNRVEDLCYSLNEFRLVGVTLSDDIKNFLNKSHK